MRSYRFALRPGWLLFHLFTVAAAVTMILLGRWQLHVSEAKHFNLRNFGYSVQWWLFAGFALFFWWRILRDTSRQRHPRVAAPDAEPAPPADEPVAYRRYVPPPAAAAAGDAVHSAYNDYLASLAAKDAEKERS